jgi:hypothetical protein
MIVEASADVKVTSLLRLPFVAAVAVTVMLGCSDDRVMVRSELLPFEPKARLVVTTASLAEANPRIETVVTDGPIEAGRAFYCEFGVEGNPPGTGEIIVIRIVAFPPDPHEEEVWLWNTLKLRKYPTLSHGAQVVHPLRFPGQWRAEILLQQGPSGRLGPPQKIGEFTFQVTESK